jgi:hypothetical protein
MKLNSSITNGCWSISRQLSMGELLVTYTINEDKTIDLKLQPRIERQIPLVKFYFPASFSCHKISGDTPCPMGYYLNIIHLVFLEWVAIAFPMQRYNLIHSRETKKLEVCSLHESRFLIHQNSTRSLFK